MVLSSNTTIPPPSTVSIVLAKRLGVTASKSCVTGKQNLLRVEYIGYIDHFDGSWDPLVRSQTHLQDAHAEGVSQDLVCLVVVTVADVGGSDEELKRVVLIQIQGASFDLLLQLPHALLPIAVSDILDSQRWREYSDPSLQ